MCLGVPGRIIETHDDRGVVVATVDFGGVTKPVCLAYTPEARVGDYAVVHAGFAIALLDETAAEEALALWSEMGEETGEEVAP
jgi:hydrogenase expression/formation protein HypC